MMSDCWLPRMWLVSQLIMFLGLLVPACLGLGNGTVLGILSAVSGSLIGGNVYSLITKGGTPPKV